MYQFHHVSLSVTDANASLAFYGALGYRPVVDWRAPDQTLRIVHLRLGDSLLELFCFARHQAAPGSIAELATDLPRIGIKHFALQVPSLEEARQHLVDLGHAPPDIPITEGRTGIRYFFIKDPDGLWVEIVQDDRDL